MAETIDIKAVLNFDDSSMGARTGQGGSAMGSFGGMMGRMAGSAGLKTVDASGDTNPAAVKRQQAMVGSLQSMAKALPGGGLMTTMAKSFIKGGPIGLIATGITAAAQTLTMILKGSQTYQTLSKSFFSILGAMGDMFLMPFIPMAMDFFQGMMRWMPKIQQIAMDIVEGMRDRADERAKTKAAIASGDVKGAYAGGRDLSNLPLIGGMMPKPGSAAETMIPYLPTIGRMRGASKAFQANRNVEGTLQNQADIIEEWNENVRAKAAKSNLELKKGTVQGLKDLDGSMEKFQKDMHKQSHLPNTIKVLKGFYGGISADAGKVAKELGQETEKPERKGIFSRLWGGLQSLGSAIGGWISGLMVPEVDLPDTPAPPSTSRITDCLAKAWDSTKRFFSDTLPNVAQKVKDGIVSGTKSIAQGVWNSAPVSWVRACTSKAASAFKGWWGSVKDWWNKSGDQLEGEVNKQAGDGNLFGQLIGAGGSILGWLGAQGKKFGSQLARLHGFNLPITGGMVVQPPAGCGVVPPITQGEELDEFGRTRHQIEQQERYSKTREARELPNTYDPTDTRNTKAPVAQKGATRASTVYHEPMDKGLFGQERGYFASMGDKFGGLGALGAGMNGARFTSIDVVINSDWSPADIVSDLDRLAAIEDVSVFNSVM